MKATWREILMRIEVKHFALAFAFAMLLAAKCYFFNRLLMPPALDTHTYWRLWYVCLCFAGMIASFVCISRRLWWTVAVALLCDLWLIGNSLYLRTYDDLLNAWCMGNLTNMDGMWASILPFLRRRDLFYPLTTLVWLLIVVLCRKTTLRRNPAWLVVSLLLSAYCFRMTYVDFKNVGEVINPFATYYKEVSMGRKWYCMSFSPIAHFMNECRNLISGDGDVPPVDADEVKPYLNADAQPTHSKRNLMIVLWESLEHWCVEDSTLRARVMPNINKLLENEHTVCFYNCGVQVKSGKSSDAQLIVCTGLLPTQNGTVCMRYSGNEYPSLAEAMQSDFSKVYVPTASSTWNQGMITLAYDYDGLYAQKVSDRILFDEILKDMELHKQSFCLLTATMASHSPFTAYRDSSQVGLPQDMPTLMQDYLHSVNYTDTSIAPLLHAITTDSLLKENTTLVIVGDHYIFADDDRAVMAPYVTTTCSNKVPFIIYDARLSKAQHHEEVYQMDIYPTLLQLSGCDDYYWKGLGENLLEMETQRHPSTDEAATLSDKLIRNNWFKK